MFTGIVEEVGRIQRVVSGAQSGSIAIAAHTVISDVHTGDSIAVNGVCLTVTAFSATGFEADVMPETLARSNLGLLSAGALVNLERALPANGRFGGHIVSGHIDGTGTITQTRRDGNAIRIRIATTPHICALIIEKGSIAIDGISLTVTDVCEHNFGVSIIPHTGTKTSLLSKRIGDVVNLENDVLGKYVYKLLHIGAPGNIGATEQSGAYQNASDATPRSVIHMRSAVYDTQSISLTPNQEDASLEDTGGITLEFLQRNGF